MDKLAGSDKLSFDLGLSPAEAQKYSVARAILVAAGHEKSGIEAEISQTLGQKLGRPGRSSSSIFVPSTLRPQQSGLDTRTNSAGSYLVGTKVPDLIQALRAQIRCVQLGATFISGLSSNVAFAVETTATSATWVSENSGVDVGDTDLVFGTRGMYPKTLQSTTSFSRQVLAQNSIDLERRIRMDLMKSHSIAIDAAAINGSGLLGSPIGLLKIQNLPTVSVATNGGPVTYAAICDLERTIADANADYPGLGFLTTPLLRSRLRQTFKNGVGSAPVWNDAVGPLGYRGEVSTAVPSTLVKGSSGAVCHAIVCGNFSEMIIGEFGALEIIVDQFTAKKTGMIQITSFGLVDILIRQPAAFAVIVDGTVT